MVDLHQQEPGMPDGHPWLLLTRWGMAWRVALGSLFVGMLGTMLLALIGMGSGLTFFGPIAIPFGVLPALLFGGLIAILGPWLRRFYPFSQGLIFGFLAAAVCAVILVVIELVDTVFSTSCLPEDGCATLGFGYSFAVVMFAGLPLALMAGVGLAIATRVAGRRRARRIFVGLFIGVGIVFVIVQTVAALGVLSPDTAPVPEKTGRCAMPGEDGQPTMVDCFE